VYCPPGEVALAPPPLLPPRLVWCRSETQGLSVPGSESLVSAARLAQQRRQLRAHGSHVGGVGRAELRPPLAQPAAGRAADEGLSILIRFPAVFALRPELRKAPEFQPHQLGMPSASASCPPHAGSKRGIPVHLDMPIAAVTAPSAPEQQRRLCTQAWRCL
jgi:hypothetical protein